MTIYAVWTKDIYESELMALFTNEKAANEYAALYDGVVHITRTYAFAKSAPAPWED